MKHIRTSRFHYPHRRLLMARARLYPDRLELTGFRWRGPYRRTILLRDVARVEWWSGEGPEPNLALTLHDGQEVRLNVPGPGLWKFALEEHAPRLLRQGPREVKDPPAAVTAV